MSVWQARDGIVMRSSCRLRLFLVLIAGFSSGVWRADAQSIASPFIDHHERAKSRLLAARHDGRLYAFVEIVMPQGWKTYWRNPGDAGGLPPTFDFGKSQNVAATRVRFPAPRRLSDRAGDTIGYKDRVLFPVEVDAAAVDKPVQLKLSANFGVCKEICVPVDASHELSIAPEIVGDADASLVAAISAVPKTTDDGAGPAVRAVAVSGASPHIRFDTRVAGNAEDAELFVEAPDGLYVPMVRRGASPGAGQAQFTATLASEAELKQLIGQRLKITLVEHAGSLETDVTVAP